MWVVYTQASFIPSYLQVKLPGPVFSENDSKGSASKTTESHTIKESNYPKWLPTVKGFSVTHCRWHHPRPRFCYQRQIIHPPPAKEITLSKSLKHILRPWRTEHRTFCVFLPVALGILLWSRGIFVAHDPDIPNSPWQMPFGYKSVSKAV